MLTIIAILVATVVAGRVFLSWCEPDGK